ncbi:hypothetical protein A1O7_06146 [Cladophialophora yegresii CBS 114405]|uniref:Uncharacterized protein n=1 Tax=Cladophialophora yegresii CBS 114405 TaxID=1182544 RepID=W9VSJ0_9EURO|nr:uncharacterized protein A1O7_06146 [Cladophialophora yegresii CBS 114405]EXJ58717.1 hypothetical protein A1O7_06146 [Cladophialophora yegresii CBS 114405]
MDISVTSVPDFMADDGAGENETVERSEHEVEIHSDSDFDIDHGAAEGTDVRVVARLWGWNAQATSMTGSETVKVSPMGERIAIAQWDKVLIYALNPEALCEEVWDDRNGSDDMDWDNGSHASGNDEPGHEVDVVEDEEGSMASIFENVEADEDVGAEGEVGEMGNASEVPAEPTSFPPTHPSPLPAPASITSDRSTSTDNLRHYYPHVQDENLGGSMALLRPVVLKMDAGAVVRKMCWGMGRWRQVNEDRGGSNDEEDEVEEPEPGEYEDNPTDEVAGQAKEKDRQAGGMENTSSEIPHPPALQTAVGEGREASIRSSENVATGNSQEQPRASSPVTAGLQVKMSASGSDMNLNEQTPRSPAEEMASAPSSAMKPTGQTQHIHRPSERDVDVDLDTPNLTKTTLVTDRDMGRQTTPKGEATPEESTLATIPSLSLTAGSPTPGSKPQTQQQHCKRQRGRNRKPRYRSAENELVVMTDRGIQIWDLSGWGRGGRVRDELISRDILQ